MKVKDLITTDEIIEARGAVDMDFDVTDVQYDSRRVGPGAMFVAIFGFATDGHKFIEPAIASGARVIVHQADLETYHDDVMYFKVVDCRGLLGVIAGRFFGGPSEKITITGITGTNGKTSSTYFLTDIFAKAGKTCARMGTINNQIGDTILDNRGRTTEESRDTQAFIAQAVDAGADELVMEASSQALDLSRLAGVHFDYGLFTNLTQDHLDYHKTFEAYFEAKAILFDQVERAAIINGDDPWGQKLVRRIRDRHPDLKVLTYGENAAADYRLTDIVCTTKGSSFKLTYQGDTEELFLDVLGRFMVFNAAGVIMAAREEGVPWETIRQALAHAPVVEGRMERVPTDLPFDIVVDFAHTPDALENLLTTVRELTGGRVIVLFGCGGDRDRGKRPKMGKIAAELADFSVLTSDNSRSEDPEAILDEIEAAVRPLTDQYIRVADRKAATAAALKLAKPGDVVVFAGKGHEKVEVDASGAHPYYEKAVILDTIKQENIH